MKKAEATKLWAEGGRLIHAQYYGFSDRAFPSKDGRPPRIMRSHEVVSDLEKLEVSEFHDAPSIEKMPPSPFSRGQRLVLEVKSLERTKYGPRADAKISPLED